MLKLHF